MSHTPVRDSCVFAYLSEAADELVASATNFTTTIRPFEANRYL